MLLAILNILDWLFNFFKPSSDKKLGTLEEVNKEQSQILKEVKSADKIDATLAVNPNAYGVSKFNRD